MRDFSLSVWWNAALITLGAALCGYSVKALAVPHEFVAGGVSGLALLAYYLTNTLTPGIWVALWSVPVFALGWFAVSRRFFFYSLYGMAVMVLFMELCTTPAPVSDPMLAALASGAVSGAGTGIALRTMGSLGGLDIIAVALNQRFSLRMGSVTFVFNGLLFLAAMFILDVDRALYSVAMVFVAAQAMEYFLGMFNQRKFAIIISDKSDEVAEAVMHHLKRGATILHGRGAFTGKRKKVLLTAVNNIQVKRLEEAVYSVDPDAFTIIGSALNVLGHRFSRRKVY
ncbi:YitT family protein [Desulfocurvus sp.]|jgi:uncharacterized membrane-anchored protein YitT (DUF2179 family)|uniref:YitT family protein n=1 Tax=Desulfocurvus sp. TaxID=2871698 RepID=UPI0025C06FB2|nr:YitT family protein [Desulfocurvus sp.]MCK9240027.1 YitT family protein [Desulfocurvus sp.]